MSEDRLLTVATHAGAHWDYITMKHGGFEVNMTVEQVQQLVDTLIKAVLWCQKSNKAPSWDIIVGLG